MAFPSSSRSSCVPPPHGQLISVAHLYPSVSGDLTRCADVISDLLCCAVDVTDCTLSTGTLTSLLILIRSANNIAYGLTSPLTKVRTSVKLAAVWHALLWDFYTSCSGKSVPTFRDNLPVAMLTVAGSKRDVRKYCRSVAICQKVL